MNKFLKTGLLMLCIVLVSGFGIFGYAKDASFVVLGDVHYDLLEDHDLNWLQKEMPGDYHQVQNYTKNIKENFNDLMNAVMKQAKTAKPAVSVLVQLGDLEEGLAGTPELAKKMEQDTLKAITAPKFPVPWVLIQGNHDITGPGSHEAYKEIVVPFIAKELKKDIKDVYYTYNVGNIEFFCLGYDQNDVLPFLEKELAASKAKFKFVLAHQPIIPVTARDWYNPKDVATRDKVLELIAKNKAIIFCGHMHKYSIVRRTTPAGPVVQVLLDSVIREKHPSDPQFTTTYNAETLIGLEPNFKPETKDERTQLFDGEAKYVTYFKLTDLPGYAVISTYDKTGKITMKKYKGVEDTVFEEVDLTALQKGTKTTKGNKK